VSGLRNVTFDNSGIHLTGQPGAHAQAIFNGTVSAIFNVGGNYNVIVRHGKFISVYGNLERVNVSRGQSVATKQDLGEIAADRTGQYVLQFQLRQETAKLNPEEWLR